MGSPSHPHRPHPQLLLKPPRICFGVNRSITRKNAQGSTPLQVAPGDPFREQVTDVLTEPLRLPARAALLTRCTAPPPACAEGRHRRPGGGGGTGQAAQEAQTAEPSRAANPQLFQVGEAFAARWPPCIAD